LKDVLETEAALAQDIVTEIWIAEGRKNGDILISACKSLLYLNADAICHRLDLWIVGGGTEGGED
jgi:hypothetical protein